LTCQLTDPDRLAPGFRCARSTRLLLLDAAHLEFEPDALRRRCGAALATTPVACFNLPDDPQLEHLLIRLGFHGALLASSAPELQAKAVLGMLEGESWFRRSLLLNMLRGRRRGETPYADAPVQDSIALSDRERRVLALLGSGARNRDIARQLCLSEHTVRTHLYNIFRKIGVNSRVEALCWMNQRQAQLGLTVTVAVD